METGFHDRLIFLSLACVMVLAVSCGRKEKAPLDFNGRVTGLIGDAVVLREGATGWDTLEYKAEVRTGDSIRTLQESQAEITFNGDNTLRIDENTSVRVRLAQDSAGAPLIDVFTGRGTVLSNIMKLAGGNDRYQVSTPTSTAAIRGTYFMVYFDLETRVSHVHCLDGRVWVANPFRGHAQVVIVTPGFFTCVGFGVFPLAPAHIPPGQWKKFHSIMPPSLFIRYAGKLKVKGIGGLLKGPGRQDMHGRHIRIKGQAHKPFFSGKSPFRGPLKDAFKQTGKKGESGKGLRQGKKGGKNKK